MKTLFNQTKKILAVAVILFFAACSPEEKATLDPLATDASGSLSTKENSEKVNVFKGPVVQYGAGKARSWISVNKEGFPVEIGIELTEDVLDDRSLLSQGQLETTVIPLHHKAIELTPFEHLGINYEPEGHPPVWGKEHFDFHFYTITNEERMAIPAYDANNQSIVDAFTYFPDDKKMPADYFKFPGSGGAMAMMGKHWLPQDFATGYDPFTHVMILGSYAQKNVFIEPMVTVDYLLSGEEFSGNYSQPITFEEKGNYYPTKYNIYHDDKNNSVYITLSDFVRR